MDSGDAEQLTLDGLAPRRRRKRAPAEKFPASHDPVAQVVLDVQATHLGQTFDYLVEERQSEAARPGALVRVRFGGRRVNGVIWGRTASSTTAPSALRYLERVLGSRIVVPQELRDDITLIANAYGGTRANIVRMAVPPRVARIEQEQRLVASFAGGADARGGFGGVGHSDRLGLSAGSDGDASANLVHSAAEEGFSHLAAAYENVAMLRDALEGRRFASFVLNPLPGVHEWSDNVAWMIAAARVAGKSAVVVLPGTRETGDLASALRGLGLRIFAPNRASGGGYSGDVAILNAAMSPAERYRAYLAITTGQVRCVIGSRAAMYAPVEGPALFVLVDDVVYQNADGMMPYANARGVLRLRAQSHHGVFVAVANARSPISQWEMSANHTAGNSVSGFSTPVQPLPAVAKETSPWIRWLNREELTRLADPSIGARVPHVAVAVLAKALETGPVLLSIPQDAVGETLSCAKCHSQARCPRCNGPLQRDLGSSQPRCRWCGAAAVNWTCPSCGGERMEIVRVGAAGTARQLQGLFRNVPMVLSSPAQPRGIVEQIALAPMLVIATPGAEPRVRGADGSLAEYRAVAMLDAWTSLYAQGVDARIDALTTWMRVTAMCAPRSLGGQALLIGETDQAIAQSLVTWNSTILASRELEERAETGLPPVCAAACVWGRRSAVMTLLARIGALDGDFTSIETTLGAAAAVLGPVPIPQPKTVDARELEVTMDRVKAVVRVVPSRRGELATRLRAEVARHVASREAGELRFQMDPKDLI